MNEHIFANESIFTMTDNLESKNMDLNTTVKNQNYIVCGMNYIQS